MTWNESDHPRAGSADPHNPGKFAPKGTEQEVQASAVKGKRHQFTDGRVDVRTDGELQGTGDGGYVRVLRYSSAANQYTLLSEIANPHSRDAGTGERFKGLVVVLNHGETFRPPRIEGPQTWQYSPYWRPDLGGRFDQGDVAQSAKEITAYLQTQGVGSRTLWSFEVHPDDVIGWAGRTIGSQNQDYIADGVVIAPGARVQNIQKQSFRTAR